MKRTSVFILVLIVSGCAATPNVTVADSTNLKPPGPDYLDNNRWAGNLKQCCRLAKPTILPATIVFSGDQAVLETRGKHTCDIKYKWLKGEKQEFALKQKGGGHKTITRDIYQSVSSQTGQCGRMQYLTIGKGKNALSIGMSRRKKGSTDFNSFFQPSVQTIAEVAGCEQLVKHATEGNAVEVRANLNRGLNPNCVFNRQTPLYNAVRHIRMAPDSNLPVVKMLVSAGAKVGTIDQYSKSTPTTLAAYLGHRETTGYLLAAGGTQADLDKANQHTAKKLAEFAIGADLIIKGGSKALNALGGAIRDGAKYNEEERARLGVTELSGIYNVEIDDDVTYVYCNYSPSVPHKMYRSDDGCFEAPSLTGTHDCSAVLETIKKRCE